MSDSVDRDPSAKGLAPLPGEAGIPNVAAPRRASVSKKGLLAVVLLIGSLVAVSAYSLHRFVNSSRPSSGSAEVLTRDKPTAATADPRRLDMPAPEARRPDAPASHAASAPTPVIPLIIPTPEEEAEPIGVRRTGSGAPAGGGSRAIPPEDAPVLLFSSRAGRASPPPSEVGPAAVDANDPLAATTRNLQGYQRQLQGLLESMTQATGAGQSPANGGPPSGTPAGVPSVAGPPMGAAPTSGGTLLGGALQGSHTPAVVAATLGQRSLILPKGTAFTCALKTKVISAASGMVGCQVLRHVYSDDGRVLLIERGSHLDGEYRMGAVRAGTVRIPVLWTRLRTPLGVTVDIDSPATGPLGESGMDGHVDNRWGERVGAAMLLSLIDDSVKLVIQHQPQCRQADTVVLPATTANTSKLAEKVLDSTINIPPLLYQNQGGIVGIYVARDVDFSSVYELQPRER